MQTGYGAFFTIYGLRTDAAAPALIAFAAADAFAGLFSLGNEADGEECAQRDNGDQNTVE
jgi:hypothetical protein